MRVSEHLVWQLAGEPLGAVVEQAAQIAPRSNRPKKTVHIANLFLRDRVLTSEQQEMVHAVHRAQHCSQVETDFVALVSATDRAGVSAAVEPLGEQASVSSVPNLGNEAPNLFEILDAAEDLVDADDLIVFSNADICPVPGFYDAVKKLVECGPEALVINRRSVFGFWAGEAWASLAAHDHGVAHPGFDCFVFPARWLPHFTRSGAIVGAPYAMQSLLLNLVAQASPLLVLTEAHLTYHYGDDRAWLRDGRADLARHNLEAARDVKDTLLLRPGTKIQSFLDALGQWDPGNLLA